MIRPYGEAAMAEAAMLIAQGRPVAIPTETVYGLAADATNGAAVARVYEVKGRPAFNPLIVHVAGLVEAERIAWFDEGARRLAERFWPGPLTLVLPMMPASGIAPIVTAGLDTIAVRVPAGRAIRALIERSGKPLAAPSANVSGGISPSLAGHVADSLGGRVSLIVDDGPAGHGIESTIVAVEREQLRLLRPGPFISSELEAAAGLPLIEGDGVAIEAPGQLSSHYAPEKPLRLNAEKAEPGEWLIGFGEVPGDDTLSVGGDLVEAAARLFAALHDADATNASAIAVAPIPDEGLGAAINDRLRRAAAPRQAPQAAGTRPSGARRGS